MTWPLQMNINREHFFITFFFPWTNEVHLQEFNAPLHPGHWHIPCVVVCCIFSLYCGKHKLGGRLFYQPMYPQSHLVFHLYATALMNLYVNIKVRNEDIYSSSNYWTFTPN